MLFRSVLGMELLRTSENPQYQYSLAFLGFGGGNPFGGAGGSPYGEWSYSGEGGDEKDELYDQAVEIVLRKRKASISLVQRELRIGYNRAARLLEDMERAGMVSSLSANGARDILVPDREAE